MGISYKLFIVFTLSLFIFLSCQEESIGSTSGMQQNQKVLPDSTLIYREKNPVFLKEKLTTAFEVYDSTVSPNDVYEMQVWRKSSSNKPRLVGKDLNGSGVYFRVDQAIQNVGDWELLRRVIHIPPNFTGKVFKFYVVNPFGNEVYFDDLKITKLAKENHPEFEGEHLEIQIDSLAFDTLGRVRMNAFNDGYLSSFNRIWVRGRIKIKGEWKGAKLRLKGDRLIHLTGDKWSMKIKLDEPWRGMTVFSIQHPQVRGFLKEWRYHQFLKFNEVPTSEYSFTPVLINGRSMGMYAYQEHFSSIVKKDSNALILGFKDELFWSNRKQEKQLDVLDQAELKNYSKRIVSKKAQQIITDYQKGIFKGFNSEKLAKYFALVDVAKAYHGEYWINQKFMYNKEIEKMEMFGHDGYTSNKNYSWPHLSHWGAIQLDSIPAAEVTLRVIAQLFQNEQFSLLYQQKLNEVSSEYCIKNFQSLIEKQELEIFNQLKSEFPLFKYDFDAYLKRGNTLRQI